MNENLDAELVALRAERASAIDAIKLIRRELGVDLGEAKRLLAAHPAWADVHDSAQPLHDAAEQALKEPFPDTR